MVYSSLENMKILFFAIVLLCQVFCAHVEQHYNHYHMVPDNAHEARYMAGHQTPQRGASVVKQNLKAHQVDESREPIMVDLRDSSTFKEDANQPANQGRPTVKPEEVNMHFKLEADHVLDKLDSAHTGKVDRDRLKNFC